MRIWIRIAIITVVAGILWCWPLIASGDPSPLPHVERPTAGVTAPPPLAATGGDGTRVLEIEFIAWIEGVARAEWYAGVEEAAREAQAQAQRGRTVSATPVGASPGSCEGIAWAIPVHLVIKESKCSFDAQSPQSFCGGYGCVGAYQFDSRHWDPNSGWGGCADLGDWRDPEAQHECARRLSRDGTNLSPWGG